ncbi:MAG TPA: hypothetical protein VFU29_13910, partial [Chitinophagaceae bacterium]|nr:hypothetical protein [Chitinophagaceae bacterium]
MKTLLLILRTKLFLFAFLSTCTFILANNFIQRNDFFKFTSVNENIVAKPENSAVAKKKSTRNKMNLQLPENSFREPSENFEATVTTDRLDYPPGDTAVITGSGFQPGETVVLLVEHNDEDPLGIDPQYHQPWTVTADNAGNFTTYWAVPTDGDALGAEFLLTADGQNSTLHAEWIFTDAITIYPSGLSVNTTEVQTLCQGAASTPLIATLATCSNGGGSPTNETNISYKWYYNITNSNNIVGATLVQTTNTNTATTTSTYTPLTIISEVGTRYYFCQVTFTPQGSGNGCGGSGRSGYPYTTATDQVTVSVNIPPFITASGTTLTLGCNPSSSDINAALGSATATDACGTPTVTQIDGAVTGSCIKSQTRTFTATDMGGSTSTTSRTVTWNDDTIAPVISGVGSSITIECPSTPVFSTPTSSDACGATTFEFNDVTIAGSSASDYSVTRTWNARDACGNMATASQTITVEDNTAPQVPLIANATGECSATAKAPTATDACAGLITGTTGDPLTYSSQGTFTIHWSFDDGNGNTSTANQTVIVDDVTAPSLPLLTTVTGECSATATAPTATDNCAGIITGTTGDPLT